MSRPDERWMDGIKQAVDAEAIHPGLHSVVVDSVRLLIERGILVPRYQADAAVAAALEQAAQHVPLTDFHQCSCGSLRMQRWQIHIRSLAKQDALDAERQRVRLEEAEACAKAECPFCRGEHDDVTAKPFKMEKQYVPNCGEMEGWVHHRSWGGFYGCHAEGVQERLAAIWGKK